MTKQEDPFQSIYNRNIVLAVQSDSTTSPTGDDNNDTISLDSKIGKNNTLNSGREIEEVVRTADARIAERIEYYALESDDSVSRVSHFDLREY